MSDTGRDTNPIPDAIQANWEQVRTEREWTWTQLAEQFERDGERQLSAWARGRARAEGGQGATEAPRRRRAKAAPPETTAAPASTPELAAAPQADGLHVAEPAGASLAR